ncbi:DMT family transporter [Erythrobacter sp. HKB08]|uniref:DMT family transporter n=1 Tax=Erythrobacter sp. HKB08 TaxID=2502843 RepID=UPI0010091D7A|nr:DMT family transporter [Erythrobacter sp. HKB08]
MNRNPHLLPLLAALLGVGFLSLMDAFMKAAALAAGAYSASVMRSAFGTAMIAPVWLLRGGRWPKMPVLRIHLLRGTVSAFMALSFFYALTKLPIAEAIAISFVAPLIALYLAFVLLGEQIKRKAVIASLLGFAGTLVIIGGRLGRVESDIETLKGLAAILFSATLYAWNFIIIRQQAQVSSPEEATTFHSGVALIVLGLFAPWFFAMPSPGALFDIAMGAALTVCGAMAITWAYARAEAQVLVPIEYSGFLWASLFGWLFFSEMVTPTTLLGTVLIVGGCWIATRSDPVPPMTQPE